MNRRLRLHLDDPQRVARDESSPELRGRARELRREMTEAELALWRALRGRQVSGLKFRRQHPVGQYIADFYCVEARLLIEADGGIHDDEDVVARDVLRDEWLRSRSITVIRIPNTEIVPDVRPALALIEAAIDLEARTRPGEALLYRSAAEGPGVRARGGRGRLR